MEKKFGRIKKFFCVLLAFMAFFSIFKFLKGKSFFDTIAEYQNDIYSENSLIEEISSEKYISKYEENIPNNYEEVGKIGVNQYLLIDDTNIYNYNSKENKLNKITKFQSPNSKIFDIVSNDSWIVWGESLETERKKTIKYDWTIWAKNLKNDKEDLVKIDNGTYEKSKENSNLKSLIPDSFAIENDNLIYRKIVVSENKENNIVSNLTTSEIILFNLKLKRGDIAYGLGDVNIELIANPKLSGNKIIFEKKTELNQNGEFKRVEILNYNIESKSLEKVIENETIQSIDIKNDKVIALIGTTDPSLFICDLKDNKKRNILYKGSKAQKYITDKNDSYELYSCEFINEDNIIIYFRDNENIELNAIIYNIVDNKFYSFQKDLRDYIDSTDYYVDNLSLLSKNGEVRAYLGDYEIKEIKENKKDLKIEETLITDENFENIEKKKSFSKFLIYQLK